MKKITLALVALAVLPSVALAQKPASQTEAIEVTAKIEAIDHSARLVTLKSQDGVSETVHAGPEVKRFDELKVGDTVTFRYYESIAYVIRKPGDPSSMPVEKGPAVVRSKGERPGATVAQQKTATVTVQTIDPKVPSITVVTEGGRRASFRVQDPKNLEGVKVGDKVEVTYTEALLISVK